MGYVLIEESQLSPTEQKAIEVTRLFQTGKYKSIVECIKEVGISKSAYYKYRNYIPVNDSGFKLTVEVDFESTIHAAKGLYKVDVKHKETRH